MRLPSFRGGAAQGNQRTHNLFRRRLSPSSNLPIQDNVSPAYDPRDATVDDDVHYCSPCDRCFASAGELQNHLARNHDATRSASSSIWEDQTHSYADNPFPNCTICGQFFGTEENLSNHVDISHPYALFSELLRLPEPESGVERGGSVSPSSVTPRQSEQHIPPTPFEAPLEGVIPLSGPSVSTEGRLSPSSSLESAERRFPLLSVNEPQDIQHLVVRRNDKWCPTCNIHFTTGEEFFRVRPSCRRCTRLTHESATQHCDETGHQSRFLVREESCELGLVIRDVQAISTASALENASRRDSAFARSPAIRTFSLDYAGTDSDNEDSASNAGDVVDAGTESLLHHCRICDNYFSSLGDLHFHRWSQACIPSLMNRPEPEQQGAPEATKEVLVEKQSVYECPLCMDEETDISSLACGHIFGTECARSALERDRRCPMCRQPSNISDLRRVFIT